MPKSADLSGKKIGPFFAVFLLCTAIWFPAPRRHATFSCCANEKLALLDITTRAHPVPAALSAETDSDAEAPDPEPSEKYFHCFFPGDRR